MSERERFSTTREAVAEATGHTGPTSERYNSALERYLEAVGAATDHPAESDAIAHSELYWNIENNLVRDVMTHQVVTVTGETPFKDIVDTLARHRISAVPVVDAGRKVLGVVSESDLLAKVVTGGDPRARLHGHANRTFARRKSHAETASELMSSPAVTIRPESSVVHAARTAAFAHVRRLPVVDDTGELVGIVTRSDLLRVFRRGDAEIQAHIADDLLARQFFLDSSTVQVSVNDGVVTLTGEVERRQLIGWLIDAVRATAGVVGVHDDLTYRVDDTFMPPPSYPLY